MESIYFREGHHYSYQDLKKSFCIDSDENLKKQINILKQYGILKTVQIEKPEYVDLSEQDIVIGEIPSYSSELVYQFSFVGVVLLGKNVIICYPKYIDNEEKPFKKMQTVIQVIEKINSKEQFVHLYNGDEESKTFNRLAISLYILKDYFENGLYTNQQEIITINGDGETLWDKTISESFAYIKNNTPYYLDYYSIDNTENDFDFIKRLHAVIVSKCSRELDTQNLLELFNIQGVEITDETLDSLGDLDYIKYRLDREIKNQFVTKKQNILKTLFTYVAENSSNETEDTFSLFGTNAFHVVWEKVCAELFENMYAKNWTINQFAEKGLIEKCYLNNENKSKKLSDYIEIPEWHLHENYSIATNYDGDLIPDIVTLKKNISGNTAMYILDGKYYLLKNKENKLQGNPGIQDVVKQYVYNSALKSFIDNFKIGEIANVFLIPKLESDTSDNPKYADVPYWSMQKNTFNELPTLQVIKLNPNTVWECYLKNQPINSEILDLIKTTPTKNYLYHNENDNSFSFIQDYQKHILVGFLRQDYFNAIKDQKEFYFYFYATNLEQNFRFPLHPYIDFCKEFIGYSVEKNQFIRGNLSLLPCERCQINEVEKTHLEELLKPVYNKINSKAATYYVLKVKNITISDKPYDSVSNFNELTKLIAKNGLNQVLYKYSPKVIDVQNP